MDRVTLDTSWTWRPLGAWIRTADRYHVLVGSLEGRVHRLSYTPGDDAWDAVYLEGRYRRAAQERALADVLAVQPLPAE